MPYEVNADLPPSVRSHLPEHAQTIFREAFNHAYAAHARDPRQEEAAFRIAWAAVKRAYEKGGDERVERGWGAAPARGMPTPDLDSQKRSAKFLKGERAPADRILPVAH